MNMQDTDTRCGAIAVIGLPNAGKSTLVNALVGSKVSIVSKKAQTTRCRIMGIAMHGNAQILLIDTPGIFTPAGTLERAMVDAAWGGIEGADAVIHIVDASTKNPLKANNEIFKRLPRGPVFLVLNKVDSVAKPALLELATTFSQRHDYREIFMISALKNEGTDAVIKAMAAQVPEGPWHFDPEQTTDLPMRFLAAEITREKIYEQLHAELPYAAMVVTEVWENFDNGDIRITQRIAVNKESQKAIVVGKGGSRIKEIGAAARADMEKIFGARVHIALHVKVEKDWSERRENFEDLGLAIKK